MEKNYETSQQYPDELDDILRMDFMSNFVFRLFENLDVHEDDPKRFKLEISVNRGATTNKNEIMNVTNHTIPILLSKFIDLNKQLNFEKLEKFFDFILGQQEKKAKSGESSPTKKPDNKSPPIFTQAAQAVTK